jgi:hypothetical protein
MVVTKPGYDRKLTLIQNGSKMEVFKNHDHSCEYVKTDELGRDDPYGPSEAAVGTAIRF